MMCHQEKYQKSIFYRNIQQVFHVYFNKFENAVTHLFLVPRFTGKIAKIPERPKKKRETLILKVYYVVNHLIHILFNCVFLYSGHYRKCTLQKVDIIELNS